MSCGFWRRSAPRASGAPAYMSTEALVTTPTSLFQLGNGSRKSRPMIAVITMPKTGTFVRCELRSKAVGM